MQFAPPRRRRSTENIVPMINVVFLLLIFFLMSAQIAPPEPFEVTPPASDSGAETQVSSVLYIAADGNRAYGAARGEAVFAALEPLDRSQPLLIRADERLPAREIAKLLPRLSAMGFTQVALATGRGR